MSWPLCALAEKNQSAYKTTGSNTQRQIQTAIRNIKNQYSLTIPTSSLLFIIAY